MDEKKRKPKLIPVRVLKASGENCLIEYTLDGLLQRATVTVLDVIDGKVADDVLAFGIPFGVPWEDMQMSANPVALANELRSNDIWTYDDARMKPMQVVSCLQAVYGVDLAALLEYARENK